MNRRAMMMLACMLVVQQTAGAESKLERARKQHAAYRRVVSRTAAMVRDPKVQQLASKHGLRVVNVMWEDTGRYKGSSVGPNISDVTIQVQQQDPRTEQYQSTCMPVIRFPNFSDKTADLAPGKFMLLVGNQRKGQKLRAVSLSEYLDNLQEYLSRPASWKRKKGSLLAPRDTRVLVSAQACFLPVPRGGQAVFNPVIFNYQSVKGDPAVLAILATREGTSATIIDNQRDGVGGSAGWGQRLFFNQYGKRATLTGQRLSDFRQQVPPGSSAAPGQSRAKANGEQGLNMVLLIQVPLKRKREPAPDAIAYDESFSLCQTKACSLARGSSVEAAVIGHGKVEGPYTEIDDLEIERDQRFPIRVTVQFYKATDNGVVSAADVAAIKAQIDRVYANAAAVGSLVLSGDTGRVTEYEGPKFEPPGWWGSFWSRHLSDTGQRREEGLATLAQLYAGDWVLMARDQQRLTECLQLCSNLKQMYGEDWVDSGRDPIKLERVISRINANSGARARRTAHSQAAVLLLAVFLVLGLLLRVGVSKLLRHWRLSDRAD